MNFHHIGIACNNISEAKEFVENIFIISHSTETIFDERQNVDLCLLTTNCGTNIELVCGNTVEKFIQKKQYLYHSCWEVENINKSIDNFCKNGSILISEPKPAVLFNNRKVAFLFTKLGIVELLQEK
ncbi:VOC family protein [bacterium]|jgi:methylmalonyl-CoA/ethylmalonyl-CoA epimerase|nr:VOC family protein [bacterium]